jgi:hypothetical protein
MEIRSLGKNYIPDSMTFGAGFFGPRGNVGFQMKFSDLKAKEIAESLDLNDIEEIEAGLDGDFTENSCIIYNKDGWKPYNAWESSQWAKPIILIKFKNKPMEAFECWEKLETN